MTMKELTKVHKLRLIADFLDIYPELGKDITVNTHCYLMDDKEKLLKAARLHGARKSFDDNFAYITIPLHPELNLIFYTNRNVVCTATKFETIKVEARPATTYEKPIEWDCHPLLATVKDEPVI